MFLVGVEFTLFGLNSVGVECIPVVVAINGTETEDRLRTGNPRKYVGLSGFGIEIAAIEPIES